MCSSQIVNHRNQVDRMSSEIHGDNSNHNSIEQLQKQNQQLRILRFGMQGR